MAKLLTIGGQALIEGVMIKSPKKLAMAARLPNGKIKKRSVRKPTLLEKNRIYKLPIVRGCISLFELLFAGMEALSWSAKQQDEKGEITKTNLAVTFVLSIAIGALMFIAGPYWLTGLFVSSRGILFNLMDGVVRILVFFIYLIAISTSKDVRRLFEYHGAEHMAVHCYEAQKELTVKSVKKYSPIHPRCGTSLLIFVLIVSILVFSLIPSINWYANIPIRILLIPVVAGISYELLKYTAKKKTILKALSMPGLLVQKITTRKPANDQIEVAIEAVKEAVR